KYLHERAADEIGWLERLSGINVNTTVIWGLHDSVAPLRVANHVWQTYLRHKPSRNRYWVVPGADHYVQCDAPREVAQIIRLTTEGTEIALQTIGDRPEGSVLVDQSGGDNGQHGTA
ncbi:MAG: alpha/beta fold hydrolase, partial [Mycobacterium sp.]